jgi:hypothetical protein
MNRISLIKLFTATAAALALAATPALAQDPTSQGYAPYGNIPNEVCAEGTTLVGGDDVGGISDSPAVVAPDGGAGGLECAEVLGETGEGGGTPISDPGGDSPGDIAGDSGSGSDDPVEAAASATASDPADPPAAEPAAARPVDSLPFTGADVTLLGAMGVGLFLLGLGLSLLTHRRSRLSL